MQQAIRRGTGAPLTKEDRGAAARITSLILGVWLFGSAFIWPHSDASRMNTWVVGALFVGFAYIAAWVSPVRWVNTLLSAWLFISTPLVFHASGATLVNNLIVALIVFVASLIPGDATEWRNMPPRSVTP